MGVLEAFQIDEVFFKVLKAEGYVGGRPIPPPCIQVLSHFDVFLGCKVDGVLGAFQIDDVFFKLLKDY